MGMAERIKERRKIMGYTQTELGEKIGLQASAIAKYENGRVENIKRSVIANMAKVLDCSPCYLLDWEDRPLTEAENESTSSIPQIITYYNELNEYGKETATEHVRLLTLDEKYTRPDEPPVPVPSMEEMEARTRQYAPFEMPEGSMPDLIRRINSNKAKDA